MAAPLGLSGHRWNNNLKSLGLLLAFPLLLLLLAFVILLGYAVANLGPGGSVDVDPGVLSALGLGAPARPVAFAQAALVILGLPIVIVAATWLAIGYLFNGALIRAATGARALDRKDAPELYNLLENLCISRGLPVPQLHVIESEALNAFASGIDQRTYAITVTRGLLDRLDKSEIEAVLGHELTHIINRDTRLLIVTVVFVGMISFLAQMTWRVARFGNSDRKSRMPLVAIAAIALAIGYALSLVLRFALSRTREYLADAGSVALTKNPEALISALRKIATNAALPGVPSEVMQMFIENPPSGFDGFGLLATHPPLDQRIHVLEQLAGAPARHKSVIPQSG